MQNWDSSMSNRIPFDLSGGGCKVVSILLSIFENQDTLTLKDPTLYQSIIESQGCDNFDGGSFPLVSTIYKILFYYFSISEESIANFSESLKHFLSHFRDSLCLLISSTEQFIQLKINSSHASSQIV